MTSLTETLPILDEAVPALPGKIESVARMGDEFHQSAQEAIGAFRQKRAETDALVEQVRQALEALRDQATEQEQHLTSLSGALDQAVDGVSSATRPGEPLFIDNTLHPANTRLALGRATQSHLHVFGLDWDETSGHNNGHFAPFHWQS